MASIQTFVIFDLEGTGLPSQPADQPVRIIEISMVAVQRPESAVPVSPPPGPRRAPSAATTAQESPLRHLAPGQRGCVTPKRPIRDSDRLAAAGVARGRPRPRVVVDSDTTPPASDGTSEEEEEEEPLPLPVPATPRVKNSLLLTVSPRKQIPAVVTDITELDNELLERHGAFDRGLADMLRAYILRLPRPVCLVAHNGMRYDFPLLKAELIHTGQSWFDSGELLCVDSLAFFRAVAAGTDRPREPPPSHAARREHTVYALDATTLSCGHDAADDCCIVCNPSMWLSFDECDSNADYEFVRVAGRRAIRCLHAAGARCVVCRHVPEHREPTPRVRRQLFPDSGAGTSGTGKRKLPSMKLPDLYERRFGTPPTLSHSAADDVDALLRLCLSYGERFYSWADRHRTTMRDVKEMWRRPSVPMAPPPPPPAARPHRVMPVW